MCTRNRVYKDKHFYEKGKLFMELFHASVTEKKRSVRNQIGITGRRKAGRSDGGPVEADALLEGQVGSRAVPYHIAKGGCLYVTTELSSQYASFYLRSKECHHKHFKTVTCPVKDVARGLFYSAYIKCNTTNTPNAHLALVITRLRAN